jgi:hypothetical protein
MKIILITIGTTNGRKHIVLSTLSGVAGKAVGKTVFHAVGVHTIVFPFTADNRTRLYT